MDGWMLIHRKLGDSPLWLNEPFTRGQAWVDLLMLANHTDGFIRVQGMRVNLKRGDVGVSEVTLSSRWQWSRGKVRRFIEELENEGMIKKSSQKTTDRRKNVLTISNYDAYQDGKKQNGTGDSTGDSTGDGQATDRRRTGDGTGTKNGKEWKNKKNIPDLENRVEIADDFYLSKKKKKLKGDALASFVRFWKAFNYHHGKAEAADAWLSVYSPGMVEEAIKAATREAQGRQSAIDSGKTPKWAQGWLTGRRWEDGSDGIFGSTGTCPQCRHKTTPVCMAKDDARRANCKYFEMGNEVAA